MYSDMTTHWIICQTIEQDRAKGTIHVCWLTNDTVLHQNEQFMCGIYEIVFT